MEGVIDVSEKTPKWVPGFLRPVWTSKGSLISIIFVLVLAFAIRYILEVGKEVEFDFTAKVDVANKIYEFVCKAKPPQ